MKDKSLMEWVIKDAGSKGILQRIEAVEGNETWDAIVAAGGITIEALNRDFSDEQREFLWDIFRHGMRIIQ